MPNISKIKKKTTKSSQKLLPVAFKTTKKKSSKIKPSPISYYNCLLTSAQSGWYDPVTGKKKKITSCCKDCKMNAPILNQQRNLELKKLLTSYQQVGDSLKKLLKPIN